jgi:hypothetical protein
MIAQYFWLIMTILVLVWYSTITIYVAIRGSFDVRHMLERLGEQIPQPRGFDVVDPK